MRCTTCDTEYAEDARFCAQCATPVPQAGAEAVEIEATIGHERTRVAAYAATVAAAAQDDRGLVGGRYQLLAPLGEGGMGTVYEAKDMRLERIVALKRVRPEAAGGVGLKRFQREAQTVADLSHANIVTVHDYGEDARGPFLVMEHVRGTSLADFLSRRREPISDGLVRKLFRGICAGVAHAHTRGVIHRDLKPGNILLDVEGNPKVADFGLARAGTSSSLSMTGLAMGTFDYASPEQKIDASRADHRADIYALGCILYQLVSGHRPPVHLDAAPDRYRALISAMVSPRPEDRPQTVREVYAAFKDMPNEATTDMRGQEPAAPVTPPEMVPNAPVTGVADELEHLVRRDGAPGRFELFMLGLTTLFMGPMFRCVSWLGRHVRRRRALVKDIAAHAHASAGTEAQRRSLEKLEREATSGPGAGSLLSLMLIVPAALFVIGLIPELAETRSARKEDELVGMMFGGVFAFVVGLSIFYGTFVGALARYARAQRRLLRIASAAPEWSDAFAERPAPSGGGGAVVLIILGLVTFGVASLIAFPIMLGGASRAHAQQERRYVDEGVLA